MTQILEKKSLTVETFPQKEVLVDIKNVFKEFSLKNMALKNISTTIKSGEITGISGPDGAGKTTLIRLLTGLMQPTKGRITVFNHDTVTEASKIQKKIGYMPQSFGLYEELTVKENLVLSAKLKGVDVSEQETRGDELLKLIDLKRFENRKVGYLSGGMKQKIALSCALLTRPRLLILDEPGVGVDPLSRKDLWSLIANFAKENIGIIWSTAYLEEAEACDKTVLLDKGCILFDGPPKELTKQVLGRVYKIYGFKNRRSYLRSLLKQHAIVDGIIQGKSVRVVLKDKERSLSGCLEPSTSTISMDEVPARFEDAYIDLLGGIKVRNSLIADRFKSCSGTTKIAVIEASNLCKTFGTFKAAQNINFSINKGEIFGLLGPNGAGKSTTFKMMCGLLKPDKGYAKISGHDLVHDEINARKKLGYMAQKFSLYGDLTVHQNLSFFAGIYGLNKKERNQKIEVMIESFDLKPYKDNSSKDLPLGIKQRLSLAAALIHNPEALFLDEPTSGVDPITRREFWMHINALSEKGVTILVTTHFMDEAEYCDRIALIYKGRRIAMDTPDNLKENCKTIKNQDPTMEEAFIKLLLEDESKLS